MTILTLSYSLYIYFTIIKIILVEVVVFAVVIVIKYVFLQVQTAVNL